MDFLCMYAYFFLKLQNLLECKPSTACNKYLQQSFLESLYFPILLVITYNILQRFYVVLTTYKEMPEGDESQDFCVIGKMRYVMHKVQG